MLILSRKTGESFYIGEGIEVTVFDIQGEKIRIGISAPEDVHIIRKEIKEIKDENLKASEAVSKEKLISLNQFIASSEQLKACNR